MHTKTMEGIVGARANMNLLNTPFRVFKEARRKGDQATMERAMGYVNECSDRAVEYQEKAEEGMKEDAKAAKEQAEFMREELIEKRKEERQEVEDKAEENRYTDTVIISEDGKVLLKENGGTDSVDAKSQVPAQTAPDTVKMEPVLYTKAGEASQNPSEPAANISIVV